MPDPRLHRRGQTAEVHAFITPDYALVWGGVAAVKLVVAPQQVIALDDVVGAAMQSAGSLGSLELQGDVASLVVTSRTYTANTRGTFGQFVPSANTADAIGGATHAFVTYVRNDVDFRSN